MGEKIQSLFCAKTKKTSKITVFLVRNSVCVPVPQLQVSKETLSVETQREFVLNKIVDEMSLSFHWSVSRRKDPTT